MERERLIKAYRQRPDHPYFELEDEAHLLRIQQRYRITRRMLYQQGFGDLRGKRILDLGCGDGSMLLEFVTWGAEPSHLAGIDLRPEPLTMLRNRLPQADIRDGCGSRLPWPNDHFDLVCLHTVLSSILDLSLRQAVAAEAIRVTTKLILCYDTFRANPSNPNVREVSSTELVNAFAGTQATIKRITFMPHWARKLPRGILEPIYPILAAIPPLCSHHLALFVKGDPA